MDFDWTQQQNELYDRIFSFAQQHLHTPEPALTAPAQRRIWQLCGGQGLPGLCIPETYGGAGLDALSTARALEAFGRGCEDMGLVFAIAAHLLACALPIAVYGSPEMKERLLPHLCAGTLIGANAITEHEAGSDVFALKTVAHQQEHMYRLSGQKSFVTNGPLADLFLVYASTNPRHGYMGISAFVLEKETDGLEVGEPIQKMGLTSAQAAVVTLRDCPVPERNLLGTKGQGATIFKHAMQWERACLFAAYVGLMERQLERTTEHARTRQQFGKPLSYNQSIAHRIVDMKLRLEAARLLLYRACWALDQGKDATLEISLAKVAVSEAALQSSLDALHIYGSAGYTTATGLEQMVRDSIPGTIFSGTSEMQRDIIARNIGL